AGVEHEIAVTLDDRLRAVVGHDPVAVVQIDEKTTARLQRTVRGFEDGPVAVVVEVAERREPGKRPVEPPLPWRFAHVALDVLDLDAARGRILPRQFKKPGEYRVGTAR